MPTRSSNAVGASSRLGMLPAANATTAYGTLVGTVLPSGVRRWQGVPYATQRRFEPSVDWSAPFGGGARAAIEPGPHCPQPKDSDDEPGRPTSEECAYLNVWSSPSVAASSPAPVLVWLHGGGFTAGMGDEYDAERLVGRDGRRVVVVTTNYRLGVLGWLGSSNLGLGDQRSALRWVQRHIGVFGGDPERVLLFGESAGAVSTGLHLLTPSSHGLFHRALLASSDLFVNSAALAGQMRADLGARVGCEGGALPCLRAVPLGTLLNASEAVAPSFPSGPDYTPFVSRGWWPAASDEVPEAPLRAYAQGRFARGVDVMVGTNSDEGTLFVFDYHPRMDAAAYAAWMRAALQSYGVARSEQQLAAALSAFPPDSSAVADNRALASRVLGDYAFTCIARMVAGAVAAADGGATAYLYRFDARAAADPSPAELGVAHGADVPFVWDHGDWEGAGTPPAAFTAAEERLARAMGDAWVAFAEGGAPAKGSWPRFVSDTNDTVAVLRPLAQGAARFDTQAGWRRDTCAFWRGYFT